MQRMQNLLVIRALAGEASKEELANALPADKKKPFLDACALIERAYTSRCGNCEPCLAGGCGMENEEACLNACLKEGPNYYAAIVEVWKEFAG